MGMAAPTAASKAARPPAATLLTRRSLVGMAAPTAASKAGRMGTTETFLSAPSAPTARSCSPRRRWSPCCAKPPPRSRQRSSRRRQERRLRKRKKRKSCCWTLLRWTARRSAHVHHDSFAWTATLQKQWPKLAARSATRGCVATARPRAWKAANGTARRSVPGVTSGTRIIACRCQQSAWGKTATKTAHHRLTTAAQTARTKEDG